MISSVPNCCKVCVFSPHLECNPTGERLNQTIEEIKNVDADLIYVRENSQNGEKLWQQIETAKNVSRIFFSMGREFSLMIVVKGDRFNSQNIHDWEGKFNFDGASISLSAYKTFFVERSSQRVYAIGLASLNIQSLPVDEQHTGDNLLKYLKLEEWFDSNKAIFEKEGRDSYSISYCSSNNVIKSNLEPKISEKVARKVEKREFKEYISHFIRFKNKEPKAKPISHEKQTVDVKTLFCKVTAKGQAHSIHRFDHDEKYHFYTCKERPAPSSDMTERIIFSTADFRHYAQN